MNTRYERMRELIWATAFTSEIKELRRLKLGHSYTEMAEMAIEEANVAVNTYAVAAERRMTGDM